MDHLGRWLFGMRRNPQSCDRGFLEQGRSNVSFDCLALNSKPTEGRDSNAQQAMSNTPETDALDAQEKEVHAAFFEMRTHAWNLERQRNAYAETLREIIWTEPDWSSITDRHPELIEP